jgi:hypothetical protein
MKKMKNLFGFIAVSALFICGFTEGGYAQNSKNAEYFKKQINDSLVTFKQTSKFEIVPLKSAWVTGLNPAGLVNIPIANNKELSYVGSYFNYNNGKFVKYYESDNSNIFGFKTESYARVKKVAVHGLLEYNNFRGNNMTFSGVLDPERLTNFIADTVPTSKRQEFYKVAGGVAFNATKWLELGASAKYETSNLSKMRDLRHYTTYAFMDVNFGAKYTSDYVDVGASYFYRKYNERVQYSKISDNNITYMGYWFKGLFFGLHDAWDAEKLYMSDQYFISKYNGLSGQAEFKFDDNGGGKWRFYNEFSFYKRRGQTGEGGRHLYSKEHGKNFSYTGKLSYDNGCFADYLTFTSAYNKITNNDQVFTTQIVSGISIVTYYGQVKVFAKRSFDWNLDYRMTFGRGAGRELNPSVDVNFGYDHSTNRSNSSFVLPYYYTQKITYNDFYVKARKNFLFKKGMFDVYAGAKWSNGWGTVLEKHTDPNFSATVATGEPKPNYLLLFREYEYYTQPKGLYNFGLRYTYFLGGKLLGNLYADVSYTRMQGKNIIYAPGKYSQMFSVAVGLNF